jgi:DhnA family fructose-bisphosphate aldolase class Ia
MGRKVFKKSRQEGPALNQRVQDVYLDPTIPIA